MREMVELSVMVDRRLVNGDGASSSSESLQPRPVVKPTPSRRSLPSRWRRLRLSFGFGTLRVDLIDILDPWTSSSGVGGLRILECGDRRPSLSISRGRGVWRSILESVSAPSSTSNSGSRYFSSGGSSSTTESRTITRSRSISIALRVLSPGLMNPSARSTSLRLHSPDG